MWACGGTTLLATNSIRTNEYVWNNNSSTSATGGGSSDISPTPSYQSENVSFSFPNNMLGVPDGAGPGDPNASASLVYMNGKFNAIGGTSAVSPIMAGLALRMNQILSPKMIGFPHPVMYPKETQAFYDIITGNNGAFEALKLYDLASGLGTPIGVEWLAAYQDPGAPIARFTAVPLTGKSPLFVTFIDGSSNQPSSWLWDFGFIDPITNKQATSILQNPSMEFLLPKGQTKSNFNVTLTVTNSLGTSSVMHVVTVDNTSGNSFPVWAIVLITIVLLLIIVLGTYFGVKHHQKFKATNRK